jgi:long-chain fatty acid transport protein
MTSRSIWATTSPFFGHDCRAVLGWKDSIDLGMGASYKLDKNWMLRCGYLFSENSQPETNYLPSAPGNDRHVFGVGVGWKGERRSVDLAYAFVYNPIRTIRQCRHAGIQRKLQASVACGFV